MLRPLVVSLSCLFWVACAAGSSTKADLLPGTGDARGVQGLARLTESGPYVAGRVERFEAHVDAAQVAKLEWSASAGALSTSGAIAEWTLPAPGLATLTLDVTHRDGSRGRLTWDFTVTSEVTTGTQTAQQALLTTPMPVLDGGTLEVSGGACDVKYEGTTTNVAIAFTTATHPSLMYGRWNGTSWTLELVDAMGFNVGGVVRQHVQMALGSTNVPHLAYVKDDQVWYATKVSGNWVRERVDTTALPLTASFSTSNDDERSNPTIALNASGQPVILYSTGLSYSTTNRIRPALATRTGTGTWTQVVALPASLANYNQLPTGDLVIDPTGRVIFPVDGYDPATGNYTTFVAWTPTGTTHISLPALQNGTPVDAAVVNGTRVLWRMARGVLDMTLNATFASSTTTFSSLEESLTSFAGDIAWAGTRPVVLHQHSNSIEIVTTTTSNFWTYTQQGTTSGVTASLAVNPSSGDVSICYQASGRIMFQ
jgi:hypothetical protein